MPHVSWCSEMFSAFDRPADASAGKDGRLRCPKERMLALEARAEKPGARSGSE